MEGEDINLPKVKLWYPRSIIYDALKAGNIDGITGEPHDRAVVRAMNAKYYPNSKVKGIPEHTIFVARLNKDTAEYELKEAFSQFGRIKRCRIVKDIITGFSLGYGFVEYEKEKEAFKAVKEGNGIWVDGKKLFVDFECERLLPGWVPRRLGGGFGGKKESGQLRFGGKERPFVKPIYLMKEWEIKRQYEHRGHPVKASRKRNEQ